jgi:PAS domain-containing protein
MTLHAENARGLRSASPNYLEPLSLLEADVWLEGLNTPAFVLDAQGRAVFANSACCRWLRCAPERFGRPLRRLVAEAPQLNRALEALRAEDHWVFPVVVEAMRTSSGRLAGQAWRWRAFCAASNGATRADALVVVGSSMRFAGWPASETWLTNQLEQKRLVRTTGVRLA